MVQFKADGLTKRRLSYGATVPFWQGHRPATREEYPAMQTRRRGRIKRNLGLAPRLWQGLRALPAANLQRLPGAED